MSDSSTSSTWALGLSGAAAVGGIRRWAYRHPIWASFLLALLVRVVVIVVLGGFSSSLVLDDATYQGMAEGKAEGHDVAWDAHTRVLYELTATLMIPLTFMYEVFGPTPLPGQIFLALAGAGVAALVVRLLLESATRKWALVGGVVAALLPSQVLWSTTILKDALVWLMLVGLAVCIAVANRSVGLRLAALGAMVAGLLFLLAHLRLHTLVVASLSLILASFFGMDRGRLPRMLMCAGIGLLIPWVTGIGIGGFDLVTDAGSLEQRRLANAEGAQSALVQAQREEEPPTDLSPSERRLIALITDPGQPISIEEAAAEAGVSLAEAERLQERLEEDPSLRAEARRESAASETAAEPGEDSDTTEPPIDPDLMHLPRGLSAMLLEPFPWQRSTSSTFRLAQLEMLVWYPLLILAMIGLRPALRRLDVAAFPLVAGGGVLVMYALTEGNLGTAYRHRGELVWAVIFLATLGLFSLSSSRSKNSKRPNANAESKPASVD